jgi:hypothetical protein
VITPNIAMPTKIQEDKNGRVLRQETITSKRKLLSDEYLLTTAKRGQLNVEDLKTGNF